MTNRSSRFALVMLLAAMVAMAVPLLTYPLGRDQGMYANIGLGIVEGRLPYRDVWDIKPPAIYYLYALNIALFGSEPSAVHMLDLVAVPLGAVALYLLADGGRRGLLTAGLFAALYFTEHFASITQSDSLAIVPTVWAALCAYRAMEAVSGAGRKWAFVCGLLCGALLGFKHYYAFIVFALVVTYCQKRGWSGLKERQTWAEIAAFCLGGAAIGGGGLLYFASNGMLAEMLVVMNSTAQYNAQGYSDWGWLPHYFRFRWEQWHILWPLAALWPFLGRVGLARDARWRLVGWWLCGAIGFLLIQGKGFDTHWLPMLAPLCLLGGDTLDRLLGWALRHRPQLDAWVSFGVLAVMVVFVAQLTWGRAWPYLSGQQDLLAYWHHFQANDVKPWESLEVVRYLQNYMPSGAPLYIWGFRPEVYYMGAWKPATRFIAHFPLATPWYPREWQQENVERLWGVLPPFVLILQSDYMPWVTNSNDDSHTLLQSYTELNDWLMFNYERDKTIGDFILWRKKS